MCLSLSVLRQYYEVRGVETAAALLEELSLVVRERQVVRGQVLYAAVKCLQSGLAKPRFTQTLWLRRHGGSMHGLRFLSITWG